MNEANLARVFGPTMVGYSTADPEPVQIMSETDKQNKVSSCHTGWSVCLPLSPSVFTHVHTPQCAVSCSSVTDWSLFLHQVMLALMWIHRDYWTTFINVDVDRTMFPADPYTPNTPDTRNRE